MNKTVALILVISFLVINTAYCSGLAVASPDDDPNDDFFPLFTEGETQFLAAALAVASAAGVVWMIRRLRAHLRAERPSTKPDAEPTDQVKLRHRRRPRT
jgi:hypothetical protein